MGTSYIYEKIVKMISYNLRVIYFFSVVYDECVNELLILSDFDLHTIIYHTPSLFQIVFAHVKPSRYIFF